MHNRHRQFAATDLQLHKREAELNYVRGLQYAREGNRVAAASALRQVIGLNPLHEQAWLRLADMLDDPHEIAFCLHVALQINPTNAQAQRGLAWLQHHMRAAQNPFAPGVFAPPAAGAPDAWWQAWRKAQRAWVWSLRVLLLLPILLLGSTLGVHAMIAREPLPVFDAVVPELAPTAQAITVPGGDDATTVSYFGTVNAEREALQAAAASYDASTSISRTTQERVEATLQMLQQIQHSHTKLAGLPVPVALAGAHQQYLEGLALEYDALKQMLDLQQNYDQGRARAAAEKMQAARARIALATEQWNKVAQHSQ